MHPHLHREDQGGKSHLHNPSSAPALSNQTPGCEELMNALEECHARGFLWKSMGMCSDAKTQVNKCLRAARLNRTAHNREVAKQKRERMEKLWADIDANS